jgi:hypothetical protein
VGEGRVRIAAAAVLCMLAFAPGARATGCTDLNSCSADVAVGPAAASCGFENTLIGADEDDVKACGARAGAASAGCTDEFEADSFGDVSEGRACTASASGAAAGCTDDQAHYADVTQRTTGCAVGAAVACNSSGATDSSGSARTTVCTTPAGDPSVPTSPDPLTSLPLPIG